MRYTLIILFFLFSCSKESNSPKSVILGNSLEVMVEDLGKLNYNDAVAAVTRLGSGWRLPNEEDNMLMCQNNDKIPNLLKNVYYWSSVGVGPDKAYSYAIASVSCVNTNYTFKNELRYVRAVRSR